MALPPTRIASERGCVRLEVLQELRPRGDAATPPAGLLGLRGLEALAVADEDEGDRVLGHHPTSGHGTGDTEKCKTDTNSINVITRSGLWWFLQHGHWHLLLTFDSCRTPWLCSRCPGSGHTLPRPHPAVRRTRNTDNKAISRFCSIFPIYSPPMMMKVRTVGQEPKVWQDCS